MKTLDQAMSEKASIIELVAKSAKQVLSTYCERKGFLLAGRAKEIASLQDKLETGRYPSLNELDDIVAFSIVVDTISQVREVIKFLEKSFRVETIKSATILQDERVFDFDCPRIYCRLEDKLATGNGIDSILIEVQIRTLLQHAWSKITHPIVYKASRFDARGARLAAELMAQLESIDRDFSRFKTTASSVKAVKRRDMEAPSTIIKMIDDLVEEGVIPKEMMPKNGRRLGENVYNSIDNSKRKDVRSKCNVIKNFISNQRGAYPRSVSIYQLAIVALFRDGSLNKSSKKHYYVTDEMISLFPDAAKIPNRVEIS